MNAISRRRSIRRGRRLVLAVPLAAALATGLSACADPAHRAGDAAAGTSAPAAAASVPASPSPSASPSKLNGTAGNRLTVSDGTKFVVMDGKLVDFGTEVHDLAWSPDGKQAAFIDGTGSLVVSAADGTARTTVAKNPGGQVWTHPTWQVTPKDQYQAARSNIFFAVEANGVLRLMGVQSGDIGGAPQGIGLGAGSGDNVQPLPQTGNYWPSSGGDHGTAVYANRLDGKVYIRDDYLRQEGGPRTTGSEPAMASDGHNVVFVRSVDGHKHLFRTGFDGDRIQDLTPKATTDYSAPTYSKDGKTIAAGTDKGIVTLPADGSAAPTLVSEYKGMPAFRG